MVSVYAHLDPNRDDDVRATWGEVLDPPATHGVNEKSPSPSGLGL
jgi:hypothetical protein